MQGVRIHKYMGCVTDKEFSKALLEQYPNRKPYSEDSRRRREIGISRQDIPELSTKSNEHEARRYYKS